MDGSTNPYGVEGNSAENAQGRLGGAVNGIEETIISIAGQTKQALPWLLVTLALLGLVVLALTFFLIIFTVKMIWFAAGAVALALLLFSSVLVCVWSIRKAVFDLRTVQSIETLTTLVLRVRLLFVILSSVLAWYVLVYTLRITAALASVAGR